MNGGSNDFREGLSDAAKAWWDSAVDASEEVLGKSEEGLTEVTFLRKRSPKPPSSTKVE